MRTRKECSTLVSIASPEAVASTSYPLDGVLILVDALRASATVCCLLHQGVGAVYVAGEVEEARRFQADKPDCLTCGERGGVKLPGFDLGNSPTEILARDLRGKSVVFTSSNFAYRLVAAQKARALLVGTSVNASACCRGALCLAGNGNGRIVIVPAGHTDAPLEEAEEDWAASSLLAQRLLEAGAELGEETKAKVTAYTGRIRREALSGIFTDSRHGRALAGIGYGEDVTWCAGVDVLSVVPTLALGGSFPFLICAVGPPRGEEPSPCREGRRINRK